LTPEEVVMPVLYAVGGIVSLGLLIYLFVALLKPEALS
jgi:K+-transporting ATPase KdpF subunit